MIYIEKIVYHGSQTDNLTVIEPKVSTHQKSCVYATSNKLVALLFMGKGNGDLDVIIASIDGKLTLVERREGILKKLYDKSGYLYELDSKTFNHYDYLWSKELISFEPVKVKNKITIDNILKSIVDEEEKGNIEIFNYPNRPSNIPLDNSDLIPKFIKYEKDGIKGSIDYLLSIYPEFKERVEEILK